MASPTTEVFPPGPLGQTNPLNWRLDSSDEGRHIWHYNRTADDDLAAKGYEDVWGEDQAGIRHHQQSTEAKYWIGLDLPKADHLKDANGNPYDAARNGKPVVQRGGHGEGGLDGGDLDTRLLSSRLERSLKRRLNELC